MIFLAEIVVQPLNLDIFYKNVCIKMFPVSCNTSMKDILAPEDASNQQRKNPTIERKFWSPFVIFGSGSSTKLFNIES
jgi:hypothetical protein